MKTLVKNSDNCSSYIFDDDVAVTITENNTITPDLIIGDLKSTNATMFENVTPPDDWAGNKYFFDGTTWTVNPNWRDLASEEGQ